MSWKLGLENPEKAGVWKNSTYFTHHFPNLTLRHRAGGKFAFFLSVSPLSAGNYLITNAKNGGVSAAGGALFFRGRPMMHEELDAKSSVRESVERLPLA